MRTLSELKRTPLHYRNLKGLSSPAPKLFLVVRSPTSLALVALISQEWLFVQYSLHNACVSRKHRFLCTEHPRIWKSTYCEPSKIRKQN